MKYFLILALGILLMPTARSQDLIVTKTNDSIHCKITKVTSDHIFFVFKKNNSYENTLIDRAEVASYQRGFFKTTEIPKDSLPGFQAFPRQLIALNSGFSYDPGRQNAGHSPNFESYLDQLRSGFHLEASYIYYVDKSLGFGVLGNYFRSSGNEVNVSGTDELGNPITTDLSGTVNVYFIGPLVSLRFLNKSQKNALILNTTIGYISYEEATTYASEIVTTGKGLGLSSAVGYNIGLNKNISIGLQLGVTSTLFRRVEITNEGTTTEVRLPDNERLVSSARLDFSIGLRYHL